MSTNCTPVICNNFLTAHERFEYWADVICKKFNPVSLDSSDRANFNAEICTQNLANSIFYVLKGSSPVTALRSRQQIAEADHHSFHLVMRRSGSGVIRQDNKETVYGAGDIILVDTKQQLFSSMDNCDVVGLAIPQAFMNTWIPNPEDYAARLLPSGKGWAAVLASYLGNLNVEMISSTNESQHLMMVEHILSLYSLALEETKLLSKSGASDFKKMALHESMTNWLRENYVDPEISTTHLAQHFNISIREVHRQFAVASTGQSCLDTLRSLRMTAAERMLKDPKFSGLNISEVAYRCGFDDPAYFGKVFRKFLGCSPGAFAKSHHKVGQITLLSQ